MNVEKLIGSRILSIGSSFRSLLNHCSRKSTNQRWVTEPIGLLGRVLISLGMITFDVLGVIVFHLNDLSAIEDGKNFEPRISLYSRLIFLFLVTLIDGIESLTMGAIYTPASILLLTGIYGVMMDYKTLSTSFVVFDKT